MNNAIPPLLQAASGALGSIAGNAVVFPLDLATTRMQHARPRSKAYRLSLIGTLYRLIQSRNGVSHLYAGLKADTISTLLSSYIYFYLYSTLHQLAIRRHAAMSTVPLGDSPALKGSKEKKAAILGTAEELLIGMLSGIISKGIVLPISAVCRRQQMEDDDDHHGHAAGQAGPKEKVSLVESIKAIHREQGFLGLYSALPPSVPLALLPSLTLYIHTILLRIIVPAKHRTHPPGAVTFLIGALSNALATLPLYPMIMIKALSQTNASGRGVTAAIKDAVGREGTAGLYRGLEGQLVKGFVQQGVMMLIKQRIEEGVVKAYRRSVT